MLKQTLNFYLFFLQLPSLTYLPALCIKAVSHVLSISYFIFARDADICMLSLRESCFSSLLLFCTFGLCFSPVPSREHQRATPGGGSAGEEAACSKVRGSVSPYTLAKWEFVVQRAKRIVLFEVTPHGKGLLRSPGVG